MLRKWWVKALKWEFGSDRNGARRSPVRHIRFKPQAELLESRLVPTAGAIDPTFGHNGTLTLDRDYVAKDVVVEGDGKIVVLAQSDDFVAIMKAGYVNFGILRFNTDGSADTSFGNNGKVTDTWGYVTDVVSLAVLGDGSILVGGSHRVPTAFGADWFADVAAYNPDGTINSKFGNGGRAEASLGGADAQPDKLVTGMAVDGHGNIVVAASTGSNLSVIRFTATGSADASFGGNGTVHGSAWMSGGLAIQSDNRIVVTAFSNGNLDSNGNLELLRYNTDGSLDTTFGSRGIVSAPLGGQYFAAAHVAVQASDGALVATADSYTVTDHTYTWWDGTRDQNSNYYTTTASFALFRLNSDGMPDTSFGKGGQVTTTSPDYNGSYAPATHTLALQDNGKILVAGSTYYGTTFVTRYNVDGTVDLTYGNGGTTSNDSWSQYGQQGSITLALQGDGKVVLASTSSVLVNGSFVSRSTLARLEADSDIRPTQFGSEAAIREYLIQQAIQQYEWEFGQTYQYWRYAYPMGVATGGVSNVALASAATDSGNTFSTTNVQQQGVDEGDTVKTDGQYLYILSHDKLVILNAWPAAQLSTLSTTALDGNALAEYLNGNRVTVISQVYNYSPIIDPPFGPGPLVATGAAIARPWFWGWSNPQVEVTVYDVSDPKNPAVVQETKYDGYYNTSRAIGSTVYVALNNNLSLPPPVYAVEGDKIVYGTEAQYRARMETLDLGPLLPHYTTYTTGPDGTHQDTKLLSRPEDIYQPGVPGDTNLLSVVSLDIRAGLGAPTHTVTFLTSYGATLYAAPDNFYLATTRWSYVNDWTFIDKISLADGGLELTATGRVPGTIMNQFSMGENGAYFDIATTSGWWHDSSNNVYVLSENNHSLDIVGRLEDFAHGERITSVRFMSDRGFVSTALNIDPLFAIDLSDPTAPRIAGQLQVPGFTGYLQLLDANHLLGIGQERSAGTQWGWGVVITLFDISDLSNPTIISRYHVSPQGWSWTNATYDYHAITYYPQYQTLTLPVSSEQQVPDPSGTGTNWIYQSAELVFHVDPTKGLDFQGQVSDLSQISRGVFINKMLYTISDTSVQVHALGNLSQLVAQVALPLPEPPWWWSWWQKGWTLRQPAVKIVADPKTVTTKGGKSGTGDIDPKPDKDDHVPPAHHQGTPAQKGVHGSTAPAPQSATLTAAPALQPAPTVLLTVSAAPATTVAGGVSGPSNGSTPLPMVAPAKTSPVSGRLERSATEVQSARDFDKLWNQISIFDDAATALAHAFVQPHHGPGHQRAHAPRSPKR
jgi:inhibitor of cysteine peptidase